MSKLLWILLFIGAYFWLSATGRSEWVIENGKALYKEIASWFDNAMADLQIKKAKPKKHPRRWD